MMNVDVPTAIMLGLIAHLIGDYVIQSDWMACEKTQRWWPAVCHAATYTAPFLVITLNPVALAIIGGTHAVIDRYRLARHLVWIKEKISPRRYWREWRECSATGYSPAKPPGLALGLLIVADNTLHIVINTAALAWAIR